MDTDGLILKFANKAITARYSNVAGYQLRNVLEFCQ